MTQKPYKRGITRRAQAIDWLGGRFISLGGIGIIAAVLGIFVFVLAEAWPLFSTPVLKAEKAHQAAGAFAIGLDPYYQTAYAVGPQGVDLLRLGDGQVIRRERPAELAGREVTAAQRAPNDVLALGTDDGHLLVAQVRFRLDYSSGQRQVVPQFAAERLVAVDPAGEPLVQVAFREGDDGRSAAAAIAASGRLVVMIAEQQQGLLGPGERKAMHYELTADLDGKATQVLLDGRIRQVLVGTDQGQVCEWRLGPVEQAPAFAGCMAVSEAAVSALAYALGEISLVVGDAAGRVSTWFKVEEAGQRSYRKIHALASHAAAVTPHCRFGARQAVSHGRRRRGYSPAPPDLRADGLAMAGRIPGDRVGLRAQGRRVFAPRPRWVVAALCPRPPPSRNQRGRALRAHLVRGLPGPRIRVAVHRRHGRVRAKAQLGAAGLGHGQGHALRHALCLALGGFSGHFTRPNLPRRGCRAWSSRPWRSWPRCRASSWAFSPACGWPPCSNRTCWGTLLLLPTVPVVVMAAAWLWQYAPAAWVRYVARVGEMYLLGAATLLVACAAYALGPAFEELAFDGHFLRWLRQDAGVGYDQRNCLGGGVCHGLCGHSAGLYDMRGRASPACPGTCAPARWPWGPRLGRRRSRWCCPWPCRAFSRPP